MSWCVVIVSKKTKKVVHRLKVRERKVDAERVKQGLDINLDHENYATKVVRI